MPIEPVDPSKKVGGNGNEKYKPPKEKFGPSEYDKAAEKVKQDNEKARAEAHKMAVEQREKVKAESPRTYTERLQDMGRLPSGGSSSTGIPKTNRDLMKNNKAGGIIKSASNRADGIAQRGKTKGRIV
jgi:hypothetical protein